MSCRTNQGQPDQPRLLRWEQWLHRVALELELEEEVVEVDEEVEEVQQGLQSGEPQWEHLLSPTRPSTESRPHSTHPPAGPLNTPGCRTEAFTELERKCSSEYFTENIIEDYKENI